MPEHEFSGLGGDDIVQRAEAALAAAMGSHPTTVAGAAKACDDIAECVSLLPELITEIKQLRTLSPRIIAATVELVHHGDMTPAGGRVLSEIVHEVAEATK